jgi:peptidoglycan/xylan/chitin deacetylase (PgdA/CDA1 family)
MRAILTWHSLDFSGSPISVEPEEFRRQVEWLIAAGVRIVSPDQLLELDDGSDAVALTFDDGFRNLMREALPVLEERSLAATVFIVTGRVGRDNRWGDREAPGIPSLPLLSWDDLGKMVERGVSLGAHTRTHPHLTAVSPGELDAELAEPALEMERRLGQRPAGFAYPYGSVDARVASAVAASYRWACTTELSPLAVGDGVHRLPRIDAWYLRSGVRALGWGSPRFRRLLWVRRQARRVRGLLSP